MSALSACAGRRATAPDYSLQQAVATDTRAIMRHAAAAAWLSRWAPQARRKGTSTETGLQLTDIPFGTTDWSLLEHTEHQGESGVAVWRTRHFGPIRVRMVEYTPGYCADHWCVKGHILLCLAGELHTELRDGRQFILKPGMSYQVADNAEPHRSFAPIGAKLFIVD